MAITPKEFIKNMGAGYNLGNMYDNLNFSRASEPFRYWKYGTYKFGLYNGSTSIGEKTVTLIPSVQDEYKAWKVDYNRCKDISITIEFTKPSTDTVTVKLWSEKYSKIINIKNVVLSSITTSSGSAVAITSKTFTLTRTENNNVTYSLDLSAVASLTSGQTYKATFIIPKESLACCSTESTAEASECRKWHSTNNPASWGNRALKEAHLKAIWAVGFRSIRMPITWIGHTTCVYDTSNSDNYVLQSCTIDQEHFEHLSDVLAMIHTDEHPFNIVINVHHDDGGSGWLRDDLYTTDQYVQKRYQSYWEQISNHFKNYDYWLQFATNNETLSSLGEWDNPVSTDLIGLVSFQQKAHDIIRSSGGKNADRIVLYPTHAAKQHLLSVGYTENSVSKNWHIPYGSNGQIDPYGIAEVHPYNANADEVIKDNVRCYKAVLNGTPVIYGEYGLTSAQYDDKSNCISQCLMVSYAKYHGMGTYLWDDFGDMKLLKKDSCTLTNYNDFEKLWVGYAHNFAPSLIKSATLKKVDIKLSNRSNIMCLRDVHNVYLDTTEDITVIQESGSSVTIKGNELTTGGLGISKILAISFIGEYNEIDIEVVDVKNKKEIVYDSGWESKTYSSWDPWVVKDEESFASFFIEVNGGDTIKFVNTTNSNSLYVREYNSSKSLITWGEKAYSLANGEEHEVQANCAYVGVYFKRNSSNGTYQEPKDGTKVIVITRDYSIPEEGFEVEDRTSSIADYTKYKGSVYRDINIIGGVSYKIDCGMPCEIQIIGYNHDGDIRESVWLNNGDVYNADLFVEKVRIILYFDKTPEKVADLFYAKTIKPLLSYEDYVSNTPLSYKETCPPKPNNDSGSSSGEGNPITYLGTIIKHNGKFVL